jgi:hypothetical protein
VNPRAARINPRIGRLLLTLMCAAAAAVTFNATAQAATHADRPARVRGLALMQRAWEQAAARLAPGQPMPRVRFWTDHMPLVGMSFSPGRRLATRRIDWPDWVNRGFLAGDPAMRLMLIHEWAHYFQRPGLTAAQAEGGAQLFTRRAGPRIWATVGMPVRNLPFADDQYPQEMAAVKRQRSQRWILQGQFTTQRLLRAHPPAADSPRPSFRS